MQLFYCPNIEESPYLSLEESKHCVKVLRKKTGDIIHVIDGKGSLFECSLKDENHKKTHLIITDVKRDFNKLDRAIHLVISPTKNLDRMEWMVEKAVEIGVSQLSFITTYNSERRNLKLDRLEKKAISAMKQSIKARLPELKELTSYNEYLKSHDNNTQGFIAHLENDPKTIQEVIDSDHLTLLIGPEGGFSEEEIDLAKEKGIIPVTLGKSRLRTETAAIVGCTLLNSL